MNNKILVFGKGYIGKRISSFFNCPSTAKRVSKISDILSSVKKYNPKTIINCIGSAGKYNVDDCETNKDKTLLGNTFVPILMAEAAIASKVKLVHISSGCIYEYNYKKQKPISENAPPDYHKLLYSRSKIYSENVLNELSKKHNILIPRIRIPLDVAPHPKNILDKLIKYKTVIDTPNSVTYVPDFLSALKHLIRIDASGIYNVTLKGGLRYPDLLNEYKKYKPSFKYKRISLKKLQVVRTNIVLSTAKLAKSGFKVRGNKEAIKECVAQYIENL